MINRKYFFDNYKSKFGSLNQSQVDGLNFLLDKLDESTLFDMASEYAYILATVKRETAETFQPVKEGYWITNNRVQKLYNYYYNHNRHALDTIFPNGLAEKNYLGRGFVQITHNYNYKNIGDKIGVDLLNSPELALEPPIAFKIMEYGMFNGTFTGKKITDYINDNIIDYYNCRKVINGLDSAREIASNAEKFYNIIEFIV